MALNDGGEIFPWGEMENFARDFNWVVRVWRGVMLTIRIFFKAENNIL